MKKICFFLIISFFLILVGCASEREVNKEEKPSKVEELVPIMVDVKIPEKINLGEEVTISATVTQGEEKVEDASEVKFQIWEKGNEDQDENIIGEHTGDGVYTIKKKFDQAGIYTVIAHVTARDMHTMPKLEVTVGDVEDPTVTTDQEKTTEEEHSHSSHHHGDGQVVIELLSGDKYQKASESVLQAKIVESEAPLSEAKVRFEIWQDGTDKHEFINTTEAGKGIYEAKYVFNDASTYHVQVHVEKGELHEHIEKTVTVK